MLQGGYELMANGIWRLAIGIWRLGLRRSPGDRGSMFRSRAHGCRRSAIGESAQLAVDAREGDAEAAASEGADGCIGCGEC